MIKDCFGKPLPKNAYVIRHTEVGDFLNCPRRWMFLSHNGLNLEPASVNDKLRIGTIWHKVMEAYYDPQNEDYSKQPAEEALATALQEDKADLEARVGDAIYYEENINRMAQEEELLRILLEGYVPWSREEADPADKDFEVQSVEKRFVVPLSSPTGGKTHAYLAVKTDGIVERNNYLWVLEHKTRGVSTKVSDPEGLALDLQLGLQILALQLAVSGHGVDAKVRGAIYNLVRKQKPGPRVKSPIYGRHPVFRSETEIENLHVSLYNTYKQMRQTTSAVRKYGWEAAQNTRYNPQIWGGVCTWGCPVKNICEAVNRGDDVEYLLTVDLKPRDRDIWQVLEEEMNEE